MPNQPPADPRLTRRRLDDAEVEKAAEVTQDDIDAAVDAWERVAPNEAKKIMDAQPTDT